MAILPLLVCAFVAQQQSDFVSGTDSLSQARQQFYHGISSQVSPSIHARVNLKAVDTLGIAWRGNDDGGTGATYIFPAGHSDRVYVTGVNPGWNAEQSVVYQSATCFALEKGAYNAVWTVDWRYTQDTFPPKGGSGLAKIISFDPQLIDNKFIRDELNRVRPYAVYRKGDNDGPWFSEFFDDQGNRSANHEDKDSSSMYGFNTFVAEQTYLASHPNG